MCQFKHDRAFVFLCDMEELIFTGMFCHYQIHHFSSEMYSKTLVRTKAKNSCLSLKGTLQNLFVFIVDTMGV